VREDSLAEVESELAERFTEASVLRFTVSASGAEAL
jgi:hypothetical protein